MARIDQHFHRLVDLDGLEGLEPAQQQVHGHQVDLDRHERPQRKDGRQEPVRVAPRDAGDGEDVAYMPLSEPRPSPGESDVAESN